MLRNKFTLQQWSRISDYFFLHTNMFHNYDFNGRRSPYMETSRTARKSRNRKFMVAVACGMECVHCGTDTDLTIDHIIPKRRGGKDIVKNYQTLCMSCNQKKGHSLEEELVSVDEYNRSSGYSLSHFAPVFLEME